MGFELTEKGADVWSGIYDVVNKADAGLGLEARELQQINAAPIIINKMANGVDFMVDRLRRRVAAAGRIDLLRIHGHGGEGIQTVSCARDLRGVNLLQSRALISYYNLPAIEYALAAMRGFFAPGAEVWLMGCEVGAKFEGHYLVGKLAKIWRVKVTAGIPIQAAGDTATFRHEGLTVTGNP